MPEPGGARHGRVRLIDGVVSTDDILPARHKHRSVDPDELARWIFEHHSPDLRERLERGDALVGNDTFGIGSSREQAVSALLHAGVGFVLAPRFGRIFFRNAWNLGLPAVEVESFVAREGDPVALDLAAARVTIAERTWRLAPVDPRMLEQIEHGGLLAVLAARIAPSSSE